MKLIIQTAFFCLSWVALAHAECPAINDVPIMYDSDHFTCARFWGGAGPASGFAIDACNEGCFVGSGYTIWDGLDKEDLAVTMGSIIVKAGCTLTLYYDWHDRSSEKQITGPVLIPNNDVGVYPSQDCGPFDTFKCRCQQKPITCTPEDRYTLVLFCDATDAIQDTTCTYTKTVGSAYTNSVEESMSIDATIAYELSEQFFGLFEESIGISVSTGYDWGHVSEETKSEEESIEVLKNLGLLEYLVLQ